MIVLSGTIGAGKSTLATILSKHLGTEAFYEQVDDNPVLPLFYKDPKQYAFLLQIYFLNKRFESIKQAMADDNNVLDRSIYEDSLFFHMNADMGRATQEEVKVYDELLENMMQELPFAAEKKAPDLLIHIDISYDTMIKRIQKRGRDYEQIDQDPSLVEYYHELLSRYDDWYDEYDYSPKMKINGDQLDYVENKDDLQIVLKQIDTMLSERDLLPKI
ncbi:MAG: deoxynucleoside kinase [Companilactobacillus sp.]|jgi:deoxyadenosine/deoxycytidine kinase|uniref:deoxynucleoside kinase n=1 Tax=Companilactobacillus sp. TaxID=2767905 RepID=UPI0025B8A227|nr:deoxynucleoside kinase [Companilactobacillus sp.]MCH4010390.1 deoxynucleoside kinase [Companilactobacillus sp.]MCH4051934.1 deoxynucleoside kinase [Companilactobacillus sp.]MCH4075830.1 deoxynucleoside kinase [Companilactobacillus sp.]MCH4126908.1 deoxynucleoside kinase [Companilactobacillus sp.]